MFTKEEKHDGSKQSKDQWRKILISNLRKLAKNRKEVIQKFAKKRGINLKELEYSITKIQNDVKRIKEVEIKRLTELFCDVKMNYKKGMEMFLVLASVTNKKEALKILNQIFARKLVILFYLTF